MTTMPLNSAADLLAGAGPAIGARPGSTTDTAEGFFALVMQALHGGTATAPGTPAAAPGTASSKAPALPGASTPAAPGAPIPAGLQGKPAKPGTSGKPADEHGESADPTATGAVPATPPLPGAADAALTAGLVAGLPAPAVPTAAGTGTTTETRPVRPGKGAAAAVGATRATPAVQSAGDAVPATRAVAATPATPAERVAAHDLTGWTGVSQPAPRPGIATVAGHPQRTEETAAVTPPTGSGLQVAAPLTTAATVVAAPTDSAAPAPVTTQVFGEVTSLVSRGNGTHRISMTLNPEALGEVRVVMTVRDGAVHVRIAAGHDARLALQAGSGELNRLLTQAGASTAHVTVRELSQVTPMTSTASTNPDPGTDLGAGGTQPDARQQEQHAGTRADNPAMDGTDTTSRRHSVAGPAAARPVDTVTSRPSGLDVTM